MDNKTKIKIGAAVLIFLVVIWQLIGLISGGSSTEDTTKMKPNPDKPTPGELLPPPAKPLQQSPAAAADADSKILSMQQETQARYLAALNELQMLKITKDIAETNKAIMKAKEDTVTSQRKIMTLLAPPTATQEEAPTIDNVKTTTNTTSPQPAMPPPPVQPQEPNSKVGIVSVTSIRGHWTAVINSGKTLYKVGVGDMMPEDQSTVIAIDRGGVTLEKNGIKKKVFMSSVI